MYKGLTVPSDHFPMFVNIDKLYFGMYVGLDGVGLEEKKAGKTRMV